MGKGSFGQVKLGFFINKGDIDLVGVKTVRDDGADIFSERDIQIQAKEVALKIHDAGKIDGDYVVVMELLPLDGAHMADMLIQLASCLDSFPQYASTISDFLSSMTDAILKSCFALHQAGVLHGDIKPENFGCDTKSNIKLLDFGLSKRIDEDLDLSSAGTPGYRPFMVMKEGQYTLSPPEEFQNTHLSPGQRKDYFSVGATIITMLTGKLMSGFIDLGKGEEPLKCVEANRNLRKALGTPSSFLNYIQTQCGFDQPFSEESTKGTILVHIVMPLLKMDTPIKDLLPKSDPLSGNEFPSQFENLTRSYLSLQASRHEHIGINTP